MTVYPRYLPWISTENLEDMTSVEGWMKPWGTVPTGPVGSTMGDAVEYWVDAWQRSVLFWDVLRKRGNNSIEHMRQGKPPVLVFDYEMILDGREFERPANYALLRIVPEPDMEIDPAKRPFVIVDPRAGHGPGIGGSKEESQIGVAMRAGHPCYFVTFFPEPMPGQTIEDVPAPRRHFCRR